MAIKRRLQEDVDALEIGCLILLGDILGAISDLIILRSLNEYIII
jgi:hypothetical protein